MTAMCTSMNPGTGGYLYAIQKSEALDGALGKIPHSICFGMVSKIIHLLQMTEMKLECHLI